MEEEEAEHRRTLGEEGGDVGELEEGDLPGDIQEVDNEPQR